MAVGHPGPTLVVAQRLAAMEPGWLPEPAMNRLLNMGACTVQEMLQEWMIALTDFVQ